MQTRPQITFRDIPHSEAIEQHIHEHIEQLEHLCDKIISCHVVIEQSQKKQHQGKIYAIKVLVDVPRKQIVSNQNHNEDIYVVIRDAFKDTSRMLKEYCRTMHGDVKAHPTELRGSVDRIMGDYGFILDQTGQEYYFQGSNVHHPDFDKLEVGTKVQFIPVVGDEGMQAHRVCAEE